MHFPTFRRALSAAALVLPLLALPGCGDIYSRDDFTKGVLNQSTQDVEKVYGKPAEIDSHDPNRVIWIYTHETFDLQNQNSRDSKTMVIFEQQPDGKLKATKVEFS